MLRDSLYTTIFNKTKLILVREDVRHGKRIQENGLSVNRQAVAEILQRGGPKHFSTRVFYLSVFFLRRKKRTKMLRHLTTSEKHLLIGKCFMAFSKQKLVLEKRVFKRETSFLQSPSAFQRQSTLFTR